ncbi:hypothetical protein P8452_06923 [Trifolium repens]|nr:hypothetical protein P8452_06923 [Trifolium repens]
MLMLLEKLISIDLSLGISKASPDISSRNPTLAGALTRLQRCAFSGSWEALTTMAIRSGEPFRLQIYEFLHTLAQGGLQSQLSNMHLCNGEDQGAGGTALVLISIRLSSTSTSALVPLVAVIALSPGEMLSATLNIVGFSWITSPDATEFESIVLDWHTKALLLPQYFLSNVWS